MYKCMTILISRKFYKTAEAAQNKLDVFYAVERLNDEEYMELTALVNTTYADVNDAGTDVDADADAATT